PAGLNQPLPLSSARSIATAARPSTTAARSPCGVVAALTSPAAGNYPGTIDNGQLTITKATPTVSVTGGTFTYDGNPHAASVAVTGVGGVTVGGSTTLSYAGIPPTNYGPSTAAPVNGGTYPARAVFTSTDHNYNGEQATGPI